MNMDTFISIPYLSLDGEANLTMASAHFPQVSFFSWATRLYFCEGAIRQILARPSHGALLDSERSAFGIWPFPVRGIVKIERTAFDF